MKVQVKFAPAAVKLRSGDKGPITIPPLYQCNRTLPGGQDPLMSGIIKTGQGGMSWYNSALSFCPPYYQQGIVGSRAEIIQELKARVGVNSCSTLTGRCLGG